MQFCHELMLFLFSSYFGRSCHRKSVPITLLKSIFYNVPFCAYGSLHIGVTKYHSSVMLDSLLIVAHQACLSMGILQARILDGLPCPPPGDLPGPGTEARISYVSCIGKRVLNHWETPHSSVKWSELKSLSRVRLFEIPWTVVYQASLSMGFSRQGYWSGLPFPSPGDHPDPGIEPTSPALQADALPSEPPMTQILNWWNLCEIILTYEIF